MKAIFISFLIVIAFKTICLTNLCPMPIADNSDNLGVMYNTFSYLVYSKNRQTISRIDRNIDLPCGRIVKNGDDLIIVSTYPDTVKNISYIIMEDPPRIFNSTFDLQTASIVTVDGNIYVFGALTNSNKITIINRNIYQFSILTEIDYNGVDLITDVTCILNDSVVFCSFITSGNEVNYVFIKYASNSFTKVGPFIKKTDMDYQYGGLYDYSDNIVVLFYYGSQDNLSCRLITINNKAYTITESSITYLTIPKPSEMIYFDAITIKKEITFCSPSMNENLCGIIEYDSVTKTLIEKKQISLNQSTNGDYSFGRFVRFKQSLSIGYAYHYFKTSTRTVATFVVNEAVCPTGLYLIEPNSVITLNLKYPFYYNDNFNFILLPDETTEGILTHNGNKVVLGNIYGLVGTYKFESKAKQGKYTISYTTENQRPLFSFSNIQCDIEIHILPCYPTCDTCLVLGTEANHRCDSCIADYYSHINHPTNCYNENTKKPNWVLEGTEYQTCSSACKTCTKVEQLIGGKYNTYCNECANGYFPYIALPECRNELLKEDNIIFDSKNNIYVSCHSNCMTCSAIGTDSNQNCNRCLSLTDFLLFDTHNCIDQSLLPLDGYYADAVNKILYPCITNCNKCTDGLSCITCKPNTYLYNSLCYTDCPLFTFIFGGICIDTCPKDTYPIKDKECVYIFESENACDDPEVKITQLNKDILIGAILDDLLNYTNNQLIAKGDDYVLQLVHKNNQSDSYNDSEILQLTKIHGDECIWKIAQHYKIQEEDIVIIKIDINQTDANLPTNKLEFIFYDMKNNIKLDYNVCKNEAIEVEFPILKLDLINITRAEQVIDQGYDPFDATDNLFNDLCTRFFSEQMTDVTIEKRREDFYQNVSFCQDGCVYNGVNLTTMTAKCECKSQLILDLSKEERKNMFISSITANFYVVKCYHLIFDLDYLINCLGFWVMLLFNLLNLILFTSLISHGIKKLKLILLLPVYSPPSKKTMSSQQVLTINTNNNNAINRMNALREKRVSVCTNTSNIPNIKGRRYSLQPSTINDFENSPAPALHLKFNSNNKNTSHNYIKNVKTQSTNLTALQSNQNAISIYPQKDNINELDIESDNENNNDDNIESNSSGKKIKINKKKKKESFREKIKNNYKEALKENKKIGNEIYFFVKTKHSVWSTFIIPYLIELRVLKVILFFNTIAIDFALNSLFYTNDYIDKRYENLIGFEFLISIPKSIISCLIAGAINIVFDNLTSSKDSIQNYLDEHNYKKQTRPHQIIPNNNINNQSTQIQTQLDSCGNIKITNNNNHKNSSSRRNQVTIQSYSQFDSNNKMLPSKVLQPISNQVKQAIENSGKKRRRLFRVIKIKLGIFCFINLIIMVLFWYYVSAFCIVMQNSQVSWIYGCLKSLGLSLVIPFAIALVLGILKFSSVKCKSEGLFTFVEIIQTFF